MFALFLIPFVLALSPLSASEEEEDLRIRRIKEFMHDAEFQYVKKEIEDFFTLFPKSPSTDFLLSLLGDVALCEHNYEEALSFFEQIDSFHMRKENAPKEWYALHQLKRYQLLRSELAPCASQFLEDEFKEGCYYYAEACYRDARLHHQDSEAIELLKEAIPFYMYLQTENTYAYHANIALAEIYTLLKEPEKAARCYLEAAKDNEEWLFYAAVTLRECNVSHAETLFEKIAKGNSCKQKEGALQWLILLYNQEKWDTIMSEENLFLSTLEGDGQATCRQILGMIALQKKDYTSSAGHLEKLIYTPLLDETTLYALAKSAYEIQSGNLLSQCAEIYEQRFGQKSRDIVLLQAKNYRKEKKYRESLSLLVPFSEDTEIEKEKAICLIEQGKASEAHAILRNIAQKESSLDLIRLDAYALSCMGDIHSLVQLLQDTLHLFPPSEQHEKKLLLAKAHFQLDNFKKAIEIVECQDDPLTSADHYFLTMCHIKEGSLKSVIQHGEKALEGSSSNEKEKLHLYLFNTYLQLPEKKEALLKAAEHLDQIIDIYPISLENHLWLARHYAMRLDKRDRAITLIEPLMKSDENLLRFPNEALTLLSLYAENGCLLERKRILGKLHQQKDFAYPERLMFHQAAAYRDEGDLKAALNLYEKLEKSSDEMVTYASRLAVARLYFALGNDLEGVFQRLQDLKTRRLFSSEPVHLEAAFDYAEFKASLAPPAIREKVLLDYLEKIKEEFQEQDNIWSKDYYAAREKFPEKEEIFQIYMKCLDLWIQKLQAFVAGDKNKYQKVQENLITLGKETKTKYLMEKTAFLIKAYSVLEKRKK